MTKRTAQGTQLQVGDGATPTEGFTAIPAVRSIDWPGAPPPDIDVSDLASTGKEYVSGLPDFGEITCEVIWDFSANALHKQLYDDSVAGSTNTRNYKRVDPGGEVRSFAAYVRNVSEPREVDGAMVNTVTLRVTGSGSYAVAP